MTSTYINLTNKKTKKQISSLLNNMGLKNTFSNYRTSIWENDEVHISVDKHITRILLYDNSNKEFTKKVISRLH